MTSATRGRVDSSVKSFASRHANLLSSSSSSSLRRATAVSNSPVEVRTAWPVNDPPLLSVFRVIRCGRRHALPRRMVGPVGRTPAASQCGAPPTDMPEPLHSSLSDNDVASPRTFTTPLIDPCCTGDAAERVHPLPSQPNPVAERFPEQRRFQPLQSQHDQEQRRRPDDSYPD